MNLYLAGDTYGKHIFPKVDFRFNKLDTFWYIYKNAQAEKDITKYDDFLLDSGAFTFIMAKRKGQSIKVDIDYFTDAYCDYINNFHIDKFFEMDVDSVLGYEKVKQFRKRIEQRTGKQPIPVFHGTAVVSYIPDKKIVGLSKLARVVDLYSNKLQNQERITSQIAERLQQELQPLGVGVQLKAQHLCMCMRGVKKHDTWTITTKLLGLYQEDKV